ncbi:MAG: hypothetical protein ACOYNC_04885 [Bacteroidales bacterium]
MKKYNHPIDDFFRDALDDHQMTPSEEARKAFLKDIAGDTPPGKRGRSGLILLSVFLLLAGAGILIWAFNREGHATKGDMIPAPSSINKASVKLPSNTLNSTTVASPSGKNKTDINTPKPLNHPGSPAKQPKEAQQPTTTKTATYRSGKLNSTRMVEAPVTTGKGLEYASSTETQPAYIKTLENPSPSTQADTPQALQPADNKSAATVTTPLPDGEKPAESSLLNVDPALTAKQESPADQTPVEKKGPRGGDMPNERKWNLDLGVYYTPEWMFNTLEGSKFVNNFGVEGTIRFGKFSVRTGAGLSIARGTNELMVAYNDFLGKYDKLDSVDFTWNSPTHDFIPTKYLSKKDVWDSLMKIESARVVKRYTYIQIPMIMGYDFLQSGRITVGVRVGPVLSVLLTAKQLSETYDPGNKRIISINDIAPEQVNLNWQVMGGISMAIRLTEKLKFELEPCARYYFNSVYEKPANNTKPWSLGLRAAFSIEF